MQHRILVFGAPGSGVTSLGKALAESLGIAHFDTDNYHWIMDESGLQFRRRRNPEHRLKLLHHDLHQNPSWLLSGSVCGWGDALIPLFTHVIFVDASWAVRRPRIAERETLRYGAQRIAPGGDLHSVYETFLRWAEAYESNDPASPQRNRARDLAWLKENGITALPAEGSLPLPELLERLLPRLQG